ncbi:cytochrome p450, partial [Trifolium pratense]
MEAMVTHNLFTGYRIGESDPISVSHLQFADDTLLLGEKSWANVRALRAALVLFKTMSGLKVNFNKNSLYSLTLRGDSRRLILWEPVLARIKNRLSGWKSRFLSFGGRLVLLKSVLTSLPVYALSFFKAPSGKWCWRMLVDREGLWFRVLAARYGVEGGRLRVGGRRGSLWWREIASIREGGGESGGRWFGDHVVRRVGDGSDTLFWTDSWMDGTPLCERFGRLFALVETKSHTVAEMFSLGWGMDGAAWVQTSHMWHWQPDPDTCYTVRGAYQLLTTMDSIIVDEAEHLIWHPQVHLKVSIFVWRLLCDRLPTKSNLVTQGILSFAAHHCVSGCGVAESAYHLFIYCSTFGSIWALVRTWIGISSTGSTSIRDHFVQFTLSAGGSRARRSFLQLIWLVSVWVVWTKRNHRLFRGSTSTPHQMLNKIKLFSY